MLARTLRKSRFLALLLAMGLGVGAASAQSPASAERGKQVFWAAGGCGCHTDAKNGGSSLAGGRAIKTPFGTFYSTNITPHPRQGLGGWSAEQFRRAMTHGEAPQGGVYFPVFPYPSFSGMTRADLDDLWGYLKTVPPVERANRPHDTPPLLGWRIAAWAWRWLFFRPAAFRPDPHRPPAWNRGGYLVRTVGHCGECHTPRKITGQADAKRALIGSLEGPEGEAAPNITPDPETGIGNWNQNDLLWFLETGMKPDGDDVQGLMAGMIENGYKHLPKSDLQAIATYLLSLQPVKNRIAPQRKEE